MGVQAEVASLSRKERQKMYIEHQLWAIHAYEDQISKLVTIAPLDIDLRSFAPIVI